MERSKTELRRRVAGDGHLSAFRRAVYLALLEVPPGRVTTYGLLARRIGCASARAVGGALRENPFAPEVPCHRVIASDLGIGGFAGQTRGAEIRRKVLLLRAEGVPLDEGGRLAEPGRIWTY